MEWLTLNPGQTRVLNASTPGYINKAWEDRIGHRSSISPPFFLDWTQHCRAEVVHRSEEENASVELAHLEDCVTRELAGPVFSHAYGEAYRTHRECIEHLLLKVRRVNEVAAECRVDARMRVVWWGSLRGGALPRWPPRASPDGAAAGTVLDTERVIELWLDESDAFGCVNGRRFSLEMLSHRWLCPHASCSMCTAGRTCKRRSAARPDDEYDTKATALARYGEFYGLDAATHDRFFWIDYSGINQDSFPDRAAGIRLLPLYIASCQRIVTMGGCEDRAWLRLERLLGAIFCEEKTIVKLPCRSDLEDEEEGMCLGTNLGIGGPWAEHAFIPLRDPTEGQVSIVEDAEAIGQLYRLALSFKPKGVDWVHMDTTWEALNSRPKGLGSVLGCMLMFRRSSASRRIRSDASLAVVTPSRPQSKMPFLERTLRWWIMLAALTVHLIWMLVSQFGRCDLNQRQHFLFYLLIHLGVWFWISLTAMAALFQITLTDGGSCRYAVFVGLLSTVMAQGFGGMALAAWHSIGDHRNGELIVNMVNKMIIMSCVGLFGAGFTCLVFSFIAYQSDSDRSFMRYLLHQGVFPVVISCIWCLLWLTAEAFSQCFGMWVLFSRTVLPPFGWPLAEMAWILIFLKVILPSLRKLSGVAERFFLPRATSDEHAAFKHTMRVVVWIDLLFDGFSCQYSRIVFGQLTPVSLALFVIKDLVTAVFNFGCKYNPSLLLLRLAYWTRKQPAGSVKSDHLPFLLAFLRHLTDQVLGLENSWIFASTVLKFHFDSGLTQFGGSWGEKEGLTRIARITCLNCCFDVFHDSKSVQSGRQSQLGSTSRGRRLGITTFRAFLNSTLDERDGEMRLRIILALQQQIALRHQAKRIMKIYSSLVLLSSNLLLQFMGSRPFRRTDMSHDANKVLSETRMWLFPLMLLGVDVFEILALEVSHRLWCVRADLLRQFQRDCFHDPLFYLALFGMMLHVSMSPFISRHNLLFC